MATTRSSTTKVLEVPDTSSQTPLLAKDNDMTHPIGRCDDARKSMTIRIPLMSIIRDCVVFSGICTLYNVHRNTRNGDDTPTYQSLLVFCHLLIVWNVVAGVINMLPMVRATRPRAGSAHSNDRGSASLSRTKCVLIALVDITISLAILGALISSINHVALEHGGVVNDDNLPKVSIPFIALLV